MNRERAIERSALAICTLLNFFSEDCKNLGVSSSWRSQTFWGFKNFAIPRKEIKQCAYCLSECSIALPQVILPQHTTYVHSKNVQ